MLMNWSLRLHMLNRAENEIIWKELQSIDLHQSGPTLLATAFRA